MLGFVEITKWMVNSKFEIQWGGSEFIFFVGWWGYMDHSMDRKRVVERCQILVFFLLKVYFTQACET